MGQPWGLSGPQFLGVYAAALAAVIIVVLLFRRAMRSVPGTFPATELSPYEVGYLSGGPRRAAEVIIAELAGTGDLRVDSRGRISEAGACVRSGPFAGSFDRAWPVGMPPGGERTARSLLIPGPRLSRLRMVTTGAIAVLLIAGLARIIEGAGNHRPVSYLVMLVIGAAVASIVLARAACGANQPTSLGARYLSSRPWSVPQGLSAGYGGVIRPSPGEVVAGASLFGVALAGLGAVEDPGLRTALIAGLPSTSGGSSSCGGGGCGGGGCGGGGCGG
jgi:hypothetical protein